MQTKIPYSLLLFLGILTLLMVGFGTIQPSNWRKVYSQPQEYWPTPTIDSGVAWKPLAPLEWDYGYYDRDDNPKYRLGKMLFFDPKLSLSGQISCSSCHDPENGWGDGRAVSLGHDHLRGNRNTPSLFNVGKRKHFNWDGRAASIQEQSLGPITSQHEMAMDTAILAPRLQQIKGYKELFKSAYGDSKINFDRIAEALSFFQKHIKSRPGPFDKFLKGEHQALTDQEILGLHLFRTKARCMNCHFGSMLTDNSFHNIGLTYYKRELEDLGRYLHTNKPEDVGKFKTPSLREVAQTGPWMHNGVFTDLEGVVAIYNAGMHMLDPTEEEKAADPLYPVVDPLLKPLNLSQEEMNALVAFMHTLSGHPFQMQRPEILR